MDAVHGFLINRLGTSGAKIDGVYFCPHHPKADVKKYRVACRCRKPNPGMILQSAREYNLDLKKSFFIGDSKKDVIAANRAKVKMILVKTGNAGKDVWHEPGKHDFIAKNLTAAVAIIRRVAKK